MSSLLAAQHPTQLKNSDGMFSSLASQQLHIFSSGTPVAHS